MSLPSCVYKFSPDQVSDLTHTRVTSVKQTGDLDSHFIIGREKKIANTQFFNIYRNRIKQLRDTFFRDQLHRIMLEEDNQIRVLPRIVDHKPGSEAIIIGTTYKDMEKKPCVLSEYDQDFNSQFDDTLDSNYCHENDNIVLEDEHGKVNLIFNEDSKLYVGKDLDSSSIYSIPLSVDFLVSGLVVGCQGVINDIGELIVSRLFLPYTEVSPVNHNANQELSNKAMSDSGPEVINEEEATYIAILSDISIGGNQIKNETSVHYHRHDDNSNDQTPTDRFALAQMLDFLTGSLGSDNDASLSSCITDIIVAGNTVLPATVTGATTIHNKVAEKPLLDEMYTTINQVPRIIQYDELTMRLASTANIISVSGNQDPTNFSCPQQPVHPTICPVSGTYNTLDITTNPAYRKLVDKQWLITDGRAIVDMLRFSKLSAMDALLLSLQSRLITPTGPDTYPFFPFVDRDPTVMDSDESVPDVYVVGGMHEAGVKTVLLDGENPKTVTLITAPSFALTKQILLINTKTLEPILMSFDGLDDLMGM